MYYELTPAYGRDYKTKAEVIKAFEDNRDFLGDFQHNFRTVSISDFNPGDTVNLRFKRLHSVAVYKVKPKVLEAGV